MNPSISGELEGRAAIVTGGGTGLGAATARGLARRGADVLVNYASSAEAAEAVAEECRAMGVKAIAMKGDVGSDDDCRALAKAAEDAFGRIDVLINNAGVTKLAPAEDLNGLDAEDFQRMNRVNVVGTYQMTRAAQPALKASGAGAVVIISSIAGVTGIGSSIAYAATKGALNTMTLSLARALAPEIRCERRLPRLHRERLVREMG